MYKGKHLYIDLVQQKEGKKGTRAITLRGRSQQMSSCRIFTNKSRYGVWYICQHQGKAKERNNRSGKRQYKYQLQASENNWLWNNFLFSNFLTTWKLVLNF